MEVYVKMKSAMMITNNLISLSWDNGVKFAGQLLSVEPTFCHTTQVGNYSDNNSGLFTVPLYSKRRGRSISS